MNLKHAPKILRKKEILDQMHAISMFQVVFSFLPSNNRNDRSEKCFLLLKTLKIQLFKSRILGAIR